MSMFQVAAVINFTEVNSQGIYILCHAYKNIDIGDLLIQVCQNRLYYYTVRKIYGFKDKVYMCAEKGYNYKIEIEVESQSDMDVLGNLKYGTYLFGNCSGICESIPVLQPNFELSDKAEHEQFYQYVFYYKNYDKRLEVQKILNLADILKRYGYDFAYDRSGTKISDIHNHIKSQLNNKNAINSLYLKSENKQFYIHGAIGFESKCMVNKIDVLLPESCRFSNDVINDKLFDLFKEINNGISPYWSCICNSENLKRFSRFGGNLPTSVHHFNYYCAELIREVKSIFSVDLPEYLICREYPFNDLLKKDLEIQKDFYDRYKFDEMSAYLQNNIFKSEDALLEYCKMLEC